MVRWHRGLGALLALGLAACPGEEAGDTADSPAADTAADTAPATSSSILVVDPESLSFGQWPLGQAQVRDLELENTGTEALEVTALILASDSGEFGTNRSRATLDAGEKLTVKVSFYAVAEGVHSETLTIHTNAANGPTVVVPLTGVASALVCQDFDGDGRGVGCVLGSDCNDEDNATYEGAPERCNLRDDDCDRLFDEDFVGLGTACTAGQGECARSGLNVCGADGASVVCNASAAQGDLELCNGQDDDCDGIADEDFPQKGSLCSIGLGACRVAEKFVCNETQTGLTCPVSPVPPQAELCGDLLDNDCDGITDEGTIEVCGDRVDNDCDGQVDESGSRWGEVFFARDHEGETVAIYTSEGDGGFEAPIVLDFPRNNRFSVHGVGDFDGDRWLDLVVVETATEGRTRCVARSDCGDDNHVCAQGVCRKRCANDGDCNEFPFERCVDTASQPLTFDTYCLPPQALHLAVSSCEGQDAIALTELFTVAPADVLGPVADVDGNGHLDVVGLHDFRGGKVGFVWLNDGEGGFTEVSPAFDYLPLFGPGLQGHAEWGLSPSAKDLDGDGLVDLLGQSQAMGGAQPTEFWWAKSLGDGTFAPMLRLGPTIPGPANLTTIADFDGDGDQDIVGGLDEDGKPGTSWILLNQGVQAAGSAWVSAYEIFDLAPSYNEGAEHPGLGEGTSFDFDGDRQPDILAAWVPEECGSFIHGCTDIQNPGDTCFGGKCRKIAFIKNITDNPCGAGSSCSDGVCVAGCTPICADATCGDDGCGGTCGVCVAGERCQDGACTPVCEPRCEGRMCGDNGCGGTCGACPSGFVCADGSCTDDCVPDCAGKACGDDGCGGRCVVFDAPQVVSFDANPHTRLQAPTNVPPTRPSVGIEPPNPTANVDLACQVLGPSYDLDPIRYHFAWFRNGTFRADIGDSAVLNATLTAGAETWTCRVFASDGVERSPVAEASATIVE